MNTEAGQLVDDYGYALAFNRGGSILELETISRLQSKNDIHIHEETGTIKLS